MMEIGVIAATAFDRTVDSDRPQVWLEAETNSGWLAFPGKTNLSACFTISPCAALESAAVGFQRVSSCSPPAPANWVAWLSLRLSASSWFHWSWPTGPKPLILDRQGLLEGGCASSRILLAGTQVCAREYRIRCDRGVVIQGAGGKELVVADIAYDSEAVLDCLSAMACGPVLFACKDGHGSALHPQRPSIPASPLNPRLSHLFVS